MPSFPDHAPNASFEALVLSYLKEITDEARATKELIVQYAERVNGMNTRLTGVEDTQRTHSTTLAVHATSLSTIAKVLAAVGVGLVSLIGGLLLYFFTHR
jgi:hypothetical protein